MSLKVKDAMALEYLEEFKLIAGENGLDRFINTVGILDHEIIENMMHIFVEGEFVLATLSVAKDNPDLVFKAIRALIDQKVAALAIKSVYYETLPDEIIEYANVHNFPIFIFHPSIFIENVIHTVFGGIKTRGHHTLLEIKLETLFSGTVNPNTVFEIAHELNPQLMDKFMVFYCQEKRFLSDENIIRVIDKFMRLKNRNKHFGLFKFRKGLIFIMSSNAEDKLRPELDLNYLFESLGLKINDFVIGHSAEYKTLYKLDTALKESYYAYQAALIQGIDSVAYDSLGIYRLVMSIADQPWSEKYANSLLEPVFRYDTKYQTRLYETIKLYFDMDCKTSDVADALYQHKNTVLQRIRKVRELSGVFKSDQDFYEQLSMAIKIYETRNMNA